MRARDRQRRSHLLRVVAATLLILGAFACGDDETTPPPVSDTVDIRNGTWHRIRTYSVSGGDVCDPLPPDTTDVVLCAYDPGLGSDPLSLVCDIEQDGNAITVTCEGSLNLFPCRVDYHLEGEGTVTDTTLDITMRRWTTLDAREGTGTICDSLYADPCTTTVVTKAAWSSATGDSACTDSGAPAPPLADFLSTMVGDAPKEKESR